MPTTALEMAVDGDFGPLSDDQGRLLEERSRATGRSVSELIRAAIQGQVNDKALRVLATSSPK